jgi:hypothetical protein
MEHVEHGGPGDDRIESGTGTDATYGGRGDDHIFGNRIDGGPGEDYCATDRADDPTPVRCEKP